MIGTSVWDVCASEGRERLIAMVNPQKRVDRINPPRIAGDDLRDPQNCKAVARGSEAEMERDRPTERTAGVRWGGRGGRQRQHPGRPFRLRRSWVAPRPSRWYHLECQEVTMPATARDRQISIRISSDTDTWLERRAGSSKNKAGFVRRLIERERERERELEFLKMFNEAAADVTVEDREERESLLGGFAGGPTS